MVKNFTVNDLCKLSGFVVDIHVSGCISPSQLYLFKLCIYSDWFYVAKDDEIFSPFYVKFLLPGAGCDCDHTSLLFTPVLW